MTHTENERLAVVETEVKTIKADVADIKVDVRWLRDQVKAGGGAAALITRLAPWVAVVISAIAFFRG